jgi:hypothetical protein
MTRRNQLSRILSVSQPFLSVNATLRPKTAPARRRRAHLEIDKFSEAGTKLLFGMAIRILMSDGHG